MATKKRGRLVRDFILDMAEQHPANLTRITAETFCISRQAVHQHLRKLIDEGYLRAEGRGRARRYKPAYLLRERHFVSLPGLEEHVVWQEQIRPKLQNLSEAADEIWYYAFTEMLNNAIDHSGGSDALVAVEQTPLSTVIQILDDGEGIFRKIANALNLEDERHAVLELSKGKLTTDPDRHTGEGIFFTSRMVDDFTICSGRVFLTHQGEVDGDVDWILEREDPMQGTVVAMKLANNTTRDMAEVFNQFVTGEDDFGFNKTVVPVRLAQYGDAKLISRSQAKRLLTRVDRFRHVILDFAEVTTIGQGFADEVFRVFANQHPEIEISVLNANERVAQMIRHVTDTR